MLGAASRPPPPPPPGGGGGVGNSGNAGGAGDSNGGENANHGTSSMMPPPPPPMVSSGPSPPKPPAASSGVSSSPTPSAPPPPSPSPSVNTSSSPAAMLLMSKATPPPPPMNSVMPSSLPSLSSLSLSPSSVTSQGAPSSSPSSAPLLRTPPVLPIRVPSAPPLISPQSLVSKAPSVPPSTSFPSTVSLAPAPPQVPSAPPLLTPATLTPPTQPSTQSSTQPPIHPSAQSSSSAVASTLPSAGPVGIIFPPPDLRSIIEKTAQFVAKNGIEFEQKVLKEQNNSRFAFLFPSNPYRPFYDMKLREFQTGKEEQSKPAIPQAILDMKKKEEEKKKRKDQILALTNFSAGGDVPGDADGAGGGGTSDGGLGAHNRASDEIKPPPKDEYSVSQPYIAAVDVDVIKMTALFVARNGQRFLGGLTQREKDNPQFDFLQPSHFLFSYFTQLVDSYTKCLMPPQSQLEKNRTISKNPFKALEWCYQRSVWMENEERKKREKEEKVIEDRIAMQAIDWHDFVVVETVEFTNEDESLPLAPPRDFSALPSHPEPLDTRQTIVAQAKKLSNLIEDSGDMEMDDEDEEGDGVGRSRDDEAGEGEEVSAGAKAGDDESRRKGKARDDHSEGGHDDLAERDDAADHDNDDNNRDGQDGMADGRAARKDHDEDDEGNQPMVVKDYVRQKKRNFNQNEKFAKGSQLQVCPITGQLVPADEMSNHLRILLLDPKWKEQKNKLLERAKKESAFAPLEDVDANLALFVAKRPDLFGTVDDQILDHDNLEEGGPAMKRNKIGEAAEAQLLAEHPNPIPLTLNVFDERHSNVIQQQLQIKAFIKLSIADFKRSLIKSNFRPNLKFENIKIYSQTFCNGNKPMENDKQLAYHGVTPGTVLKMMVQ